MKLFSVVCNEKVPEGMPEENPLPLTFLDQCYWVLGTLIGRRPVPSLHLIRRGWILHLTALFIVIFTEQWMSQKNGTGCGRRGLFCSVPEYFGQGCPYHTAMIAILGVVECRL